MTHEVAGFGGDIHFSKMDFHSECFMQIFRNWVRGRRRGREGRERGGVGDKKKVVEWPKLLIFFLPHHCRYFH